jgi:hypothetical protein
MCLKCGISDLFRDEPISGELFEEYLGWFLLDNPHESKLNESGPENHVLF